MEKFRIALLQLLPLGKQNENLEKGLRSCERAKEMGADLALFPEMWNTGYDFSSRENDKESGAWTENAISRDSEFVKKFQAQAKKLEMAIALTYLEKWPGLPRNTVSLIDRSGSIILTYAKVHTCDFDLEKHLTPGDDFYAASLDTGKGEIKIGAMICYDREFPESARILMLKGAEIIIVPNACPMEINRKSQLRTRAFENMLGIAMTNYAGGKLDCNGHSLAYDGMAYGETGPNQFEARDTLVIEAGSTEGIYMAEFDMEKIRAYRKREVWGNAYRRTAAYSLLISENVEEPFIRKDFRK
jgi:predicted amidohydrolase